MTITGPYTRINSTPGLRDEISWYRGGRAGSIPLPLTRVKLSSRRNTGPWSPESSPLWNIFYSEGGGEASLAVDRAYRQAFDRFASKVKAKKSAALGVSLAESNSSLRMIIDRADTLRRSYRALKRGNLPELYRSLANSGQHRRQIQSGYSAVRRGARDASSVYLEFQFGWKPLIDDIYSAVDVLQSDLPSGSIRGRGSDSYRRVSHFSDPYFDITEDLNLNIKVQVGGRVHVSNPNLALANQLGVVNPAAVAWDLIPFSFLVGYFIPVGAFLESYSTLWGFNVDLAYVSHLRQGTYAYRRVPLSIFPGYLQDDGGYSQLRRPKAELDVPTFRSRVRLPGGDLLGKATSSVALLIQQLTNRK